MLLKLKEQLIEKKKGLVYFFALVTVVIYAFNMDVPSCKLLMFFGLSLIGAVHTFSRKSKEKDEKKKVNTERKLSRNMTIFASLVILMSLITTYFLLYTSYVYFLIFLVFVTFILHTIFFYRLLKLIRK